MSYEEIPSDMTVQETTYYFKPVNSYSSFVDVDLESPPPTPPRKQRVCCNWLVKICEWWENN